MAKFPEPPGVEALRDIPPVFADFDTGTRLARIHFASGPYPGAWSRFRHFGPTASRFDPHLPDTEGGPSHQQRGVLYAACGAEAVPTALAEVFQTQRLIDTRTATPVLSVFDIVAPLRLLDLSGPYVTAIGASTAIHSGPRARAQRWARQLYAAWPDAAGLLYCSSMYGNAPALALFERASPAIPHHPLVHRMLSDPALRAVLIATAATIRYDLV